MIVILTQCFPSRIGGIETLISNLALGLSKDNKVIVFADRHHLFFDAIYDNKIKDHFLVRRISGLKFFRRRRKIKEFKSFVLSGKVTCVIAESWKSLELCIDLLNNKKIPTICLAHGNELLQTNSKKIKKIFNILNQTSAIVANSNYTLSLVKQFGLKKPILERIYPGTLDFQKIKETKINKIQGHPIMLTLARLEKRKGHFFVLNCIEKLKNEFSNLQYIIAGEGPELSYLKKIVKDKKLDKNVIFLGKINDSEKKYIFTKTDLMIMPTIDESKNRSIEGFGISYIEAALFGIPSIASNVGGTSEAVFHNKTGIVLNHIDELEVNLRELLTNQEKRKLLGKEAKIRVLNELQWENITNQYLSLISSITAI